jgi:hypothetical protein
MNQEEAQKRLAAVWVRILQTLIMWTTTVKSPAEFERELAWIVDRLEKLAAEIESRAAGARVVIDQTQFRTLEGNGPQDERDPHDISNWRPPPP